MSPRSLAVGFERDLVVIVLLAGEVGLWFLELRGRSGDSAFLMESKFEGSVFLYRIPVNGEADEDDEPT